MPYGVSHPALLGAHCSCGQGPGVSTPCRNIGTRDKKEQEKGLRVMAKGAHHCNTDITNTVQPAPEPVITSTPYQTELCKGLADLGLSLLSFLTSSCSLAKTEAFLQVLVRSQTLTL